MKVAKEYAGRVTFCVSKEEEYLSELKDLRLDDSGEDINVGFFAKNKLRYAMTPTEDFNEQVLKDFVEDVLNGRVKPTLKSQTPPARNEGPVVTVVGDTFEDLVTKADKDVMIEFYAQWCGHCKSLEPVYRQLAEDFSDDKRVVFAKIEATSNDFPEEFEVSGFPTIYYIRKEMKGQPNLYSGDRSLEDLKKFVESMVKRREEL